MKNVYALLTIGGCMVIGDYNRIGIWAFYKFLKIKIHNKNIQNILSVCTIISGIILLFVSNFHYYKTEELIVNILRTVLILFLIIGYRYLTIKSDHLYFPLDDAFYLDKNGYDIRKNKHHLKNNIN